MPPGGARLDAPPLHRCGRSLIQDVRRVVHVSGTVCAATHPFICPAAAEPLIGPSLSGTTSRTIPTVKHPGACPCWANGVLVSCVCVLLYSRHGRERPHLVVWQASRAPQLGAPSKPPLSQRGARFRARRVGAQAREEGAVAYG